jgi:heat shock protein HtpX
MTPTLYTQQSKNVWKTYFLMAFFLAIVVALGLAFSVTYDNPLILYFAFGFSLLINFWSYWFSDKIALKISGAKPIDPVNNPEHLELQRITENLSIAAGLPTPRIYIIEDNSPNAFATGRNKNHSAVAVTTGLMSLLDRSEIEGVIAHELAHIGNRDILLSSVVVVLVGLIAIASDFFIRSRLLFGGRDNNRHVSPLVLVLSVVFIILSPIVATIIQLAISRKREFLADATGALITRYPEGLASALQKIGSYNIPLKRSSNATAHMYISNPFGSQAFRGVQKLFMTHPPTEDRIKALIG